MARFLGCILAVAVSVGALPAATPVEPSSPAELVQQGDAMFAMGQLENIKNAAVLFGRAFAADPQSYEAAWKAARSYREYCQLAKEEGNAKWQEIGKEYGKKAMEYGDKAINLQPKGIEGHFWYGCSVGNYSDGVSVLTALREGLKNKTQEALEKSYQIDKNYREGGPIKALGRFWFVLPWPLADKSKALQLLSEFNKSYPDDPEGQVFLAEVLLDQKKKAEALPLLEQASRAERTYYADLARRLLAENR
jgi:tetratricopeptide (TPR) repeat protein